MAEHIPDDCARCHTVTERKKYVRGEWLCYGCAKGCDTRHRPDGEREQRVLDNLCVACGEPHEVRGSDFCTACLDAVPLRRLGVKGW